VSSFIRVHRRQQVRPPSGHENVARVAWSILRALGRYERMGCEVKQIVVDTRIPERTVKRHLADLLARGLIQSPHRGHYVHVPDAADILADPTGKEGVHGLVIHGSVARTSDLVPPFGPGPVGPGRFIQRVEDWRGRIVRLRYFPATGSIVVYVPASRLPIPWLDMRGFREWLAGRFYPVQIGTWRVVEWGLNTDYEGWQMAGVQSVSLDRFDGTVERFYNKTRSMVRHEVHGKRPHTLDQVVKLLKEGSLVSQYERILRMELELSTIRARSKTKGLNHADAWEGGYA
jgi:hypothetical protein